MSLRRLTPGTLALVKWSYLTYNFTVAFTLLLVFYCTQIIWYEHHFSTKSPFGVHSKNN